MSDTQVTYQNKDHSKLEQSINESEDEEIYNNIPPPPDGGYGWVIVVASFGCNMVVDGIAYTFGLFLFEIIDFYGESKGKTAWVGSLLSGTYMSVGPIVSALCNKFGCRAVCIAGSLISTVAFVLSIFSPTVNWLMLTYGFLGGFGFGLIYLPAVVCVGYYFDGKRSLATGIAVCGSGVGTFVFAPLASFLLRKYGWRGANLILAGIIFNCAIFGALMRPLQYPKNKNIQLKATQKKMKQSLSGLGVNSSKDLRKRYDLPETALIQNDHKEIDGESLVSTSKLSLSSRKEASHIIQPLAKKDIFYSGSIHNIVGYQSQKSLNNNYRYSMLSIPHVKSHENISGITLCTGSLRSSLGALIDVSLLKDPVFMTIGLSNLFAMAAIYVPFIYIVDFAKSNGIDAGNASFLLSIIGITNTIGRIACGYLTDLPQVNALFVNNICLVIATVSVGLTPFCHTFGAYAVIAIFYAIAVSGYISLSSIILVDLLGIDKLTNAFGLLILFRGTAAFIGSPLAGALYDATLTYDVPFYVAAALYGLSALTSFLAPCLKKTSHEEKPPNEVLKPINEEKKLKKETDIIIK